MSVVNNHRRQPLGGCGRTISKLSPSCYIIDHERVNIFSSVNNLTHYSRWWMVWVIIETHFLSRHNGYNSWQEEGVGAQMMMTMMMMCWQHPNFGKWIAPRESMYNRFCFGLPAYSSFLSLSISLSLSLPLFPSLYRYIHAFIESFYLKAPQSRLWSEHINTRFGKCPSCQWSLLCQMADKECFSCEWHDRKVTTSTPPMVAMGYWWQRQPYC